MMNKTKNFARFFALFKQIPNADQDLKESYVSTFTNGRTSSLHEMAPGEYNAMCDRLQAVITGKPAADHQAEIKKARSAFLKRLTKIGVDTSDWSAVDQFCLNTRNIGKRFSHLTIEELRGGIPKLEAIAKKKRQPEGFTIAPKALPKLIKGMSNQIPS